jgi:uncharacterized protein (TIGR02679 family)
MAEAWAFLDRPALARLWAAARRKIEREGKVSGAVSLADPSPEERRAIAGLLARPEGCGRRERVDLCALDATLRRSPAATDLRSALVRLGYTLQDRTTEAAAAERRRGEALAALRRCRHADQAWFGPWVDSLRSSGRVTRLDRGGELAALARVATVLDQLPDQGVAIGVLAHRCTGDPKALDGGALAGLVLMALAAWAELDPPHGRLDRRRLWERFGVVRDELSSQVLVRNLPLASDSALGRMQAAAPGEPLRLTLRQLLRHPPQARAATVYVCENPVLVREAAERGVPFPLVCTEGQPSAACIRLLHLLRAAGCRILAHADFDAAGLHIVRRLIEDVGAEPWAMSAADYRAALATGGHDRVGQGLSAPWEPGLAVAMEAEGRGVYEEAVVDELLGTRGQEWA